MSSTNVYTIADLQAMKDLHFRNKRSSSLVFDLDNFIERESTPNLQYLLDKGYDCDVAMRAALAWDARRWPGNGYQEVFVSDEERAPIPTEREWLLSCGYDVDVVDGYLEQMRVEDEERAAAIAKREAYERTWRYRIRKTWREGKTRVRLAWSVLRGHGQVIRHYVEPGQ